MTEQTWINPEVDRSGWGTGPWDGEPDKVAWTDPATGYPCIASRGNPSHGSWCGYVAVEPGHPLHGKGHYDADELEVHGGLTFAAPCAEDEPVEKAVCHVPEPGKSGDVHWFGFDCHHAFDYAPAYVARMRELYPHDPILRDDGGTYRTLEYVKAECASLAKQLKDLDA